MATAATVAVGTLWGFRGETTTNIHTTTTPGEGHKVVARERKKESTAKPLTGWNGSGEDRKGQDRTLHRTGVSANKHTFVVNDLALCPVLYVLYVGMLPE